MSKEETKTRKFSLKFGYQDKENPEIFHRKVEIGRRPTGADFFKAAEAGTDDNAAKTRINLLLIASTITNFGELMKPSKPEDKPLTSLPATVVFSLNEIDEDKLNDEYMLFLVGTQPETEQKVLEGNRAQLAFGIERGGVKYHVVEFGHLLTGHERVKIMDETPSDWHYTGAKIAREVVKISTLDDAQSLDGALTFEEIEAMDVLDFLLLREVEKQWLDSFRD